MLQPKPDHWSRFVLGFQAESVLAAGRTATGAPTSTNLARVDQANRLLSGAMQSSVRAGATVDSVIAVIRRTMAASISHQGPSPLGESAVAETLTLLDLRRAT